MAGALAGRRIVIALPRLELGGAGRQALLLARHLVVAERAVVEVWGLGEELDGFARPGRLAGACDALGIRWRCLALPQPLTWLKKAVSLATFVRELRHARVEILLPYTAWANALCGLAWRLGGARACVWSERNADPRYTATLLQRAAARSCPVLIANSRCGVECLIRQYGARPSRVHYVPNGVELAPARSSRAAWRLRLGIHPTTLLVCMVAHFHTDQKDHGTVARAWQRVAPQLASRGRAARLAFAGGAAASTRTRFLALLDDLGIRDQVELLGEVSDVTGLLQACDLAVFSSRFEGTPNGVLESMAAGLPVVATDLPGIRDALGAAGTRFLCPVGDAAGLAHGIVTLLLDAAAREAEGNRNRQRIADHFSPAVMVEHTTRLIRDALS
ncbi:MAG: glycosyltransferase [Deltaproteobacteria bacterium]|nr:glycosyltransferase [Deltaproteobacteria bacterium]